RCFRPAEQDRTEAGLFERIQPRGARELRGIDRAKGEPAEPHRRRGPPECLVEDAEVQERELIRDALVLPGDACVAERDHERDRQEGCRSNALESLTFATEMSRGMILLMPTSRCLWVLGSCSRECSAWRRRPRPLSEQPA